MGNTAAQPIHEEGRSPFQPRKRGSSNTDYESVDVFSTGTTLADDEIMVFDSKSTSVGSWVRTLRDSVITGGWRTLLLLALIGVAAALAAFCVDTAIFQLYNLKLRAVNSVESWWGAYVIWVLWGIVFCFGSGLVVRFLGPQAAGSGIPEMKSILSGITFHRYLSIRTLVAKVIGIICAFTGGLHVGKEGPYVHVASIVAHQLLRLPCWRDLTKNEGLKMQILAAACAVGVSTSFGSPIGGVIFSVEVTATYYLVENLWKAFFCAMCGAVVIKVIGTVGGNLGVVELFTATIKDCSATGTDVVNCYNYGELLAFLVLGVLGGLLGALFVRCFGLIIRAMTPFPFLRTHKGFIVKVVVVSAIISFIGYPFVESRNDLQGVINYLLQDDKLGGEWGKVVGLLFATFGLTLLSIAIFEVPCGIYLPLFLVGASFGRLVGELLAVMFPHLAIRPNIYAITGAASVCAGTTRTISTAVIVIELTGQISLLLPILICVLMAVGVCRVLDVSVYDMLLHQKGLPYMPAYRIGQVSLNKRAHDVMRSRDELELLSLNSTYGDAEQLLMTSRHTSFPLVDSLETMTFMGSINREELQDVLEVMLDGFSPSSVMSRFTSMMGDPQRAARQGTSTGPQTGPLLINEGEGLHVEEEALHGGAMARLDPDERRSLLPFVFTTDVNDLDNVVMVDPTTFHLHEQCPLFRVHYMFTMLGLSHAFVTNRGCLVGCITRKDLVAQFQDHLHM